jgi:DNA topoisomerase VI subunit B
MTPTTSMERPTKKVTKKKARGRPASSSAPSAPPPPARRPRANAESMAKKQREISVSEFFAKNRHLLGFDNPRKALLTTVKEAVDNALDACEEAEILPEITIQIEELIPPASAAKSGRYRVTILDNGPGIVRKQVENIFGKLLYGSKFHRLKMSRGQQGIGISAAGMYGLMTTGKPMVINTRHSKRKPAHHIELAMDTTKNAPEVTLDIETDDFPETSTGTGTQVAIELEAKFVRGKVSVDAYIEQTAIANPHAKFVYIPPDKNGGAAAVEADDQGDLLEQSGTNGEGKERADESAADQADQTFVETIELDDRIIFPRTIEVLPTETQEIKPHPYGVELGTFLRMLKNTEENKLGGFLKHEFCRITPSVANEIYKAAKVSGGTWLKSIDHASAEKVYRAIQDAKLRSPPTDCLSPIGVRQMLAGLLKGVEAEFYSAATRSPAVYRGNPFQIEAAIAFGGKIPGDQPARVIRFANRVPLLYQQSSCSAFKSVTEASWRNYGLSQPRGSLPVGPMVVMIHMASVWVPFTSESKEAIADYDEIRKEMKLALQECGRKLGTYLRKRQKMKRESQRRDVFERYIGEISRSCEALTGADAAELYEALLKQAKRRTEIADAQLDEDGKVIKADDNGRLDKDDGVLIVDRDEPNGALLPDNEPNGLQAAPGRRLSKAKTGSKKSSPSKKRTKKVARKPAKKSQTKKPTDGTKPRVRIALKPAQESLFEGDSSPRRKKKKVTKKRKP